VWWQPKQRPLKETPRPITFHSVFIVDSTSKRTTDYVIATKQRRQSIWKSGGVQLPLSSPPVPFLSTLPSPPFLSLPLPFPFPPSFPFPGHPQNQLGGLGEHCKLPQWGLGQSPKAPDPKGAALAATFFVDFHKNKFKPRRTGNFEHF